MQQNWDINATAKQLTPPLISGSPQADWIQVLLSPLVSMYATFNTWMTATSKLATYTPSTIKLQALLNDGYDNTQRRIVIHNNWYLNRGFYVGLKGEVPKVHLGLKSESPKVYIGKRSEYQGHGNFVVICAPGSLTAEQQRQIKITVNKYRLAGTVPYYMYSNGLPF